MSPVDEVTRGRQVAENFCQEHWPEASFEQVERLGEWLTQHAIRTQSAKDPVATFDEAFAGTTWPSRDGELLDAVDEFLAAVDDVDLEAVGEVAERFIRTKAKLAKLWAARERRAQKISEGGTDMRAAGESPARVEEQSALPGTRSDKPNHEGGVSIGAGPLTTWVSSDEPSDNPDAAAGSTHRRESALPDPVAVVDDAFRSTTWPNQDTPRSCSWCWRVLPEHEAGCEAVELVALRRVAEAARAVLKEAKELGFVPPLLRPLWNTVHLYAPPSSSKGESK